MQIIETDADVATGAAWLAQTCPRMAVALAEIGPLPLRRRPDGFAHLLSAIISQQVSVASARAIWKRMEDLGLTNEAAVLAAGDDGLRAAGLSRQKIAYSQALAAANIDYVALRTVPDAEVIKTLTAVKGIGVWTAEIYAMFSLGRPDVFAPGDLALKVAAQGLYDLPERPTEKQLRAQSLAWSPWRSVAARALFAYYHIVKGRDGIT
ncbi:MAG: DNA-3-methyladenine glycosylase II [Ascidiaceihabitans sp.]|jgi:DNA-3-methyladenine glycosylase II